MLKFRAMEPDEQETVYMMGFKEWGNGRSYHDYRKENHEEDKVGIRYVLLTGVGDIVASNIVFDFGMVRGHRLFGPASLVTALEHRGQGYGVELLRLTIEHLQKQFPGAVFIGYADAPERLYEAIGFQVMPPQLQHYELPRCMIYPFESVSGFTKQDIPKYF